MADDGVDPAEGGVDPAEGEDDEAGAAPAIVEASVDGSLWEGPGGPLAGMAAAVLLAGGLAVARRLRKRR